MPEERNSSGKIFAAVVTAIAALLTALVAVFKYSIIFGGITVFLLVIAGLMYLSILAEEAGEEESFAEIAGGLLALGIFALIIYGIYYFFFRDPYSTDSGRLPLATTAEYAFLMKWQL